MTGFGAGVCIETSLGYFWHNLTLANSNTTHTTWRNLDPNARIGCLSTVARYVCYSSHT
jgi:hypothetical protein